MIHRIIKSSLKGELIGGRLKKYRKLAMEAAEHSSETERLAVSLEREVEKMKKAEYMLQYLGEEFEGIISGVTGFGIYVELENTIEGMIRLDSLYDDYYIHEPEKYRVIGEHTNKIYALGQKVSIIVDGVDVENREIDFVFSDRF